jgi:hypothetical protein
MKSYFYPIVVGAALVAATGSVSLSKSNDLPYCVNKEGYVQGTKQKVKVIGSRGVLSVFGTSLPFFGSYLDDNEFTQHEILQHDPIRGYQYNMNAILKAALAGQSITLLSHSAGVEVVQKALNDTKAFLRWARRECGSPKGKINRDRLGEQDFYHWWLGDASVPDISDWKKKDMSSPFDGYCALAFRYDLGLAGDTGKPKLVKDWLIIDKSSFMDGGMHVDVSMVESTVAVVSTTEGFGSRRVGSSSEKPKLRFYVSGANNTNPPPKITSVENFDLTTPKQGFHAVTSNCHHTEVDRSFYRSNDQCYANNQDWILKRLSSQEQSVCLADGQRWIVPQAYLARTKAKPSETHL